MTCKYPTCSNPVGQQDREDYRSNKFCSIQCDVTHDKRKMEAKEARLSERENEEPAPGREP